MRPRAECDRVKSLVASGLTDCAIALAVFCGACDAFGIRWTQPTAIHISVARAPDVAKFDEVVGPKSSAGSFTFSS